MSEAAVLKVAVDLVQMGPCWSCGILYAAPRRFKEERLADISKSFYCPNGHATVFRKSEVDRLRERLEEEKRKTAWAEQGRDSVQKRLDHTSRSRDVYKGKLHAVKERIKNGVCPCCNRSFVNLKRHMATKHPRFKEDDT